MLGRSLAIGISISLLFACGEGEGGNDAPISLCTNDMHCADSGPDDPQDSGADLGHGNADQDSGTEEDAQTDAALNCPEGQITCSEDGLARIVCQADNQMSQRIPCATDQYCVDGTCIAQICPRGESVCEGQIARLCDDRGSAFLEGADEDCEALGQTCTDGLCADSIDSSRGATCIDVECMTSRPQSLVCGRYATDVLETTPNPFRRGPAGQCDPGSLTEAAYAEALRLVNYARWLTGLPEVTYDQNLNPRTQACAMIMANQRALSHNPPPQWACYTPEGAQAAGESNIHLSSRSETIIESVIGYFHDGGDNNRADVGHRRWLQSPTLGLVGFGYHHSEVSGSSASCYNVIASDAAQRSGPPFIAYPNPGVFPIELLTSRFWTLPWSISIHAGFRDDWAPTGSWTVSVWRVEDGQMTPLQVNHVNASGQWYGRNHAIVFSPVFEVTPGEYHLLVEGPEHRFEWTTELVRCGP